MRAVFTILFDVPPCARSVFGCMRTYPHAPAWAESEVFSKKSDFKKGHISNAVNYDVSSGKSIDNKDVVVYDKDEMASVSSAEKLSANQSLKVYYLEGGVQSWIENNLPLAEKK